MAPEHPLRALIDRYNPGKSTLAVTTAAGVSENKLGYWLKPGTKITRMPTMDQMREMAQIIGCSVSQVYMVFRLLVDGSAELVDGLSDEERDLLATYRSLSGRERERLRRVIRAFTL